MSSTVIHAGIGRVAGVVPENGHAARIEVGDPSSDVQWTFFGSEPRAVVITPVTLWHRAGSVEIQVHGLEGIDTLIAELAAAREIAARKLIERQEQINEHQRQNQEAKARTV